MAAKNPKVVTVEACGVSVEVDLQNFADVRVMTAMAKVSDETLTDGERLIWYTRALDLIFGGATYEIQNKLADANGGRLDMDTFKDFFAAVMNQGEAKN